MANIRKHKNYDSKPSQLLAYELAVEAQNIMYVMAGINALAEAHHPSPAMKVRVVMEGFRKAMVNEAMASAGVESSPAEW